MTDPAVQYQRRIEGLATTAAEQVAAILQTGQITGNTERLIVAAISRANAAAASLADAFVAAHIEYGTAKPTPAVGLAPRDDTARLAQAVRTILDDQAADAGTRFQRLAHAEPLATAQRAAIAVMAEQPAVNGWRWRLDAGACELCRWYAADGRVYRLTRRFRQPHPGCNCQPEPVMSTRKTKERKT